jgi:hypothetical protein
LIQQKIPFNRDILEPVPNNFFRDHLNYRLFVLPGHKVRHVLDFKVVSVILFDWDFYSFLDVVHVSVEVRNVLDVAYGLWNVEGLLFVDHLFYLLDLGWTVLDCWTGLCYV